MNYDEININFRAGQITFYDSGRQVARIDGEVTLQKSIFDELLGNATKLPTEEEQIDLQIAELTAKKEALTKKVIDGSI